MSDLIFDNVMNNKVMGSTGGDENGFNAELSEALAQILGNQNLSEAERIALFQELTDRAWRKEIGDEQYERIMTSNDLYDELAKRDGRVRIVVIDWIVRREGSSEKALRAVMDCALNDSDQMVQRAAVIATFRLFNLDDRIGSASIINWLADFVSNGA